MSNLAFLNSPFKIQLSLPREHGIVVIFSIASLFSLIVQVNSGPFCAAIIFLWLLVLSMQNPRQLTALTISGALFSVLINPLLALWLLIVGLSLLLIKISRSKHSLLLEFTGLGGATLTPLMTAYLINPDGKILLTIATALMAAVYSSAAIVHGVIHLSGKGNHERMRAILNMILALPFWIGFALLDPSASRLSLIAYIGLILWLHKSKTTSLKELGMLSAFCLTWVSLTLLLTLRI